jgi:hypothetical protein
MFWYVNTPSLIQDRYLRRYLLSSLSPSCPSPLPPAAQSQFHSPAAVMKFEPRVVSQFTLDNEMPLQSHTHRGDGGWAANDNGGYKLYSTARKKDDQGFVDEARSGDDNRRGWVIRQVFSMSSLSFANTKLLLTTVCTSHLLGPPLHRQVFATLPHHPTHRFIRSLHCRTRRRLRHSETSPLSFRHQVLH